MMRKIFGWLFLCSPLIAMAIFLGIYSVSIAIFITVLFIGLIRYGIYLIEYEDRIKEK